MGVIGAGAVLESCAGLVQLENNLAMGARELYPRVKIEGTSDDVAPPHPLHRARPGGEILEEELRRPRLQDTGIRKTIRYAEAPVKG